MDCLKADLDLPARHVPELIIFNLLTQGHTPVTSKLLGSWGWNLKINNSSIKESTYKVLFLHRLSQAQTFRRQSTDSKQLTASNQTLWTGRHARRR